MTSSPEAAFLLNNVSYKHLFDIFKNVTDLPADLIVVSGDNERIPSNKYLLSIFSSTVRQVLASYPYGVDPVILLPDYSSFSIKHLLSIINKGVTESSTFNPVRFTKDCEEISGIAKVLAIDLSGVRFEYIDDNRTNSLKAENDPKFDYKIKMEVESLAESSTSTIKLKDEHVELLPKTSNSEIVHKNETNYMTEPEETKADIFDIHKDREAESTNIKDLIHKDVQTDASIEDSLPKDLETQSIHKDLETDAINNRTIATKIADMKLTNDETGQIISSQFKPKKIFDCQICFQKLKHSCYHYVKNHYFDKIMSQTNLSQSGKVCPLCEKQCNNKPMLIYHISSRHDGHINRLLSDDGFAPVQKSELDTLKKQISNTSKLPLTNLLSKIDNERENGNIEVSEESTQSQDVIDSKRRNDLKEKITSTKADQEKMYPEINITEKNPPSEMDIDKSKPKQNNSIEYSQEEKNDPKAVHENFKRQEGGVHNFKRETKRKMEQSSPPDRKLRPRVSEFPDLELNLASMLEPEVLLNENKIDASEFDKSKFMNLLNLHEENDKSEKIVRQNKPRRSTHSRSRSENPLRRSNSVKKDLVSPIVKSNNTATPKRSSMRLLSKPKIQYNVDSKMDDDSDQYITTSKSSTMNKSKPVDDQIEKIKSSTSNISATISKGTPLKPNLNHLTSSPLMSNFTNWNNQSKLVKSEPRNHPIKKEIQSFGTENLQKILGNISVSVIRPGEINENNVKSELEKRLGGNISISSV